MKYLRTAAFFLHRLPALASGNTPVLLLTEELGKIRVLVKGLQGPKSSMASRLDPLVLLDTQLYRLDENASMLTQASVTKRFADLSLPLERIEGLWQQLGAMVALLPEGVPHPEVMELHEEFLELLPTVKQPSVLGSMALLKLLQLLGHIYISPSCLHCDKDLKHEEKVHVRTEDMLIVCDSCMKLLPTAVGLNMLPHLAFKTLLLYQEKGLQLADVVKIPEEIAKTAASIVLDRYRHLVG